MDEWHKIDELPPEPMTVELYFANIVFRDQNGAASPVPSPDEPYRDERREIGFWDGETFCENGTGHSLFEDWRAPYIRPTHWRKCAPPPTE